MQCFIREQKKHWSYIFVSFENDMEPPKIQDSRALVNKKKIDLTRMSELNVADLMKQKIYIKYIKIIILIIILGRMVKKNKHHFVNVHISLDTVT